LIRAAVRFASRRIIALTVALLPATGVGAGPVAFGTSGGDAWAFEKKIDLTVSPAACDEVEVISPRGHVSAWPKNDRLSARVLLNEGANRISAQCRKAGIPQGAPVEQDWLVRLRDGPVARAGIRVTPGKILLDADVSEPAPGRNAPIERYAWRVRSGGDPLSGLPADTATVVLPASASDGEYFVTLRVTDSIGRSDESTIMFRVRGGRPEAIDPAREHAAWIDRAVIYGVEPRLFGPRGFADVTARLDALAGLGVTTLWLTPVTAAPPGDFGYAITDHFRLGEGLGDGAALHELIAQAHARGLRVILDFVANHLSEQHPYFADAAANERASPYFEFFERAPDGTARHYFDWNNLENLNYGTPEVQRMMIEACARWVRDYDVDGFRVDAAWGPRQREPGFWPRWRAELKRIKPDLLLLAEASARDDYYDANGFDAAYDWTEKLGQWAWQDAFDGNGQIARRLRTALDETIRPAGPLIFRFLNNNDTGKRFIARHGAPLTRVAATMLLTLPGIPGLYSGDEVGAAFEPYRPTGPIAWDDIHGLRDWYARLIELRARHASLRSGEYRLLDVGSPEQVLAYVRPAAGDDPAVLVLLNFTSEAANISLTDKLPQEFLKHGWTDVLHQDQGGMTVELPAYGARILRARSGMPGVRRQ
jgi:cyclomaltodextrinase / maltogenic alpha-amylase / neopullulanase